MARLVDDSDDSGDEFPELAVVIRKRGRIAKKEEAVPTSTDTLLKETVQAQTVLKSASKLENISLNISLEAVQGLAGNTGAPNPGKRVHRKTSENGCLRQLGRQKTSTTPLTSTQRQRSPSTPLLGSQKAGMIPHTITYSSISSASENKEDLLADATRLSDFIVNDSSLFEEDITDEETQSRPSRPIRRLVRGRRLGGSNSSQECHSESLNDIRSGKKINTPPSPSQSSEESDGKDISCRTLKNRSSEAVSGRRCGATPLSSPQKAGKRLLSPKKPSRIPMIPHRPSMDTFWDPDVINEWNEEYSPRKAQSPHHGSSCNSGLVDGKAKSQPRGNQFNQHQKRQQAKKSFALKKHDIAETFLRELDEKITDGKISEMAISTGGIKVLWSKKLNTTAGRTNWKRETIRSSARNTDCNAESIITYRHHASIELAEKVIDNEERLLNVIAHEFCHLANFMVSDIRNNPHGKEFKAWAAKCSHAFGNRGINVTTKHSYEIDYKFAWKCTNCGTEFKRHSKSIDPLKHQCGSCKSKLVQIKPTPRAKAGASEYQLFFKENMRVVREQNPGSPQKQIMSMVGKMYQEHKASKLGSCEETLGSINAGKVGGLGLREESSEDSDVGVVVRKLKFLDMRSP